MNFRIGGADIVVNATRLLPTTGEVTVKHEVSQVNVAPDDAADFQIVTSRITALEFTSHLDDNALQGLFGEYGIHPIPRKPDKLQLTLPPDMEGRQEARLYLGTLNATQSSQWTKAARTPVRFVFHVSQELWAAPPLERVNPYVELFL